jgi:hypothetical protein
MVETRQPHQFGDPFETVGGRADDLDADIEIGGLFAALGALADLGIGAAILP